MSTEQEQRADFANKQALATKERELVELRALVARHERANGVPVAELQAAREERDAAKRHYHERTQDVIRLEALVERHGLNACEGAAPVVPVSELTDLVSAWRQRAARIGSRRDIAGNATKAGAIEDCVNSLEVVVARAERKAEMAQPVVATECAADEREPSVSDVAKAVTRKPALAVGARVRCRPVNCVTWYTGHVTRIDNAEDSVRVKDEYDGFEWAARREYVEVLP